MPDPIMFYKNTEDNSYCQQFAIGFTFINKSNLDKISNHDDKKYTEVILDMPF
ncbi:MULTISPECIES: hypothetical protein [Moraxella]|uniref:Uncharacterized protein n=1 Tax=Moraxella bovis TaxID=476 RepID=A0AAQ2T2B9_MORBO|nr:MULTISPECIES: hypothetical protein [Moraxella]UYZ68476.1 hypothetical protein LP122_12165 [Moraxella bovis]UYZ70846.1 hypothetical protein LP089_12255 [Moraxella bovis]UYZ73226.1 hypothetical protein LP105_00390 [Moraxella bovis]UYZ75698.1 hypothetical protein LP093_13400 [Moraxella bovis]UYZ78361.1 hypothetical protein LP115_00400 [Moraxella bovis]